MKNFLKIVARVLLGTAFIFAVMLVISLCGMYPQIPIVAIGLALAYVAGCGMTDMYDEFKQHRKRNKK